VTIQNPKTLEWKPAVVLDKAGGLPRSYVVSTPSGKELHRNRSQLLKCFIYLFNMAGPSSLPKQVKFDLKSNQVHSSSPGINFPINIPGQSNPRNSAGPVPPATQPISPNPGAAQSASPTPGVAQSVTSAPNTGSQYVTRSGRVVKAPSRMDI